MSSILRKGPYHLSDRQEKQRLLDLIYPDVVDVDDRNDLYFRLDWVLKNNFDAILFDRNFDDVPYEPGDSWIFIQNLAAAAQTLGCDECLAIPTAYVSVPLGSLAPFCRLPIIPDVLNEHMMGFMALDYIYIPENRKFALYFPGEVDYTLVGPREFIEQVFEANIEIVRQRFLDLLAGSPEEIQQNFNRRGQREGITY